MQFNTAIAHLMEFLNAFSKLEKYSKNSLKIAIQMLYPFAPHIGEEMNEILGFFTSLTFEPLQKVNEKFLIPDSITYIIQVNGKLRARLDLPQNVEEKMLINLAK